MWRVAILAGFVACVLSGCTELHMEDVRLGMTVDELTTKADRVWLVEHSENGITYGANIHGPPLSFYACPYLFYFKDDHLVKYLVDEARQLRRTIRNTGMLYGD